MKGIQALASVIKGVGSPLHQIPSGKSLMDMKIEFILKSIVQPRAQFIENHGSERQHVDVETSMMNSKAALMAQTIDSGATVVARAV